VLERAVGQDSHMDVGVRAMQGAIAGVRLARVARQNK